MFFFILFNIIILFYVIGYLHGKRALNRIFEVKLNIDKELSKELKNFISYSQYFEDLILFSLFYDIRNGFYIDIGASDPNEISVTKAFYMRGWYGINIEPLPDKYQALIKNRNRDINLQIGAGEKEENSSLYIMGAGSSTFSKYVKRNVSSINITIYSMKNICKKYVPKNVDIQFCKIDVEGGERNVLLGYDFKNYRPKIFCIESTEPKTNNFTYNLWEEILLKNDYSFAYQYLINRFYIDNRIKLLRERFIIADELIKIYKKN